MKVTSESILEAVLWENPMYGILEGAQETWAMAELGTRFTSESVDDGNSLPKVARACALLDPIYSLDKKGGADLKV